MPTKKLILVIGATGGQGTAVVDKLLAPAEDGSPSPYAVRALTRDPHSRRAKELADKGVELFKGEFSFYHPSYEDRSAHIEFRPQDPSTISRGCAQPSMASGVSGPTRTGSPWERPKRSTPGCASSRSQNRSSPSATSYGVASTTR